MITGVVLARNEARHIAACLRSFRPHVSELLLIDMESADDTVALARPYVDQVLPAKYASQFDAARNLAINEAKNEWLWYVDADERVSEATARFVHEVVTEGGRELSAIWIPFKTHFCGKWIEHSGWWPGYTMPRVLKKGRFRFSDRLHGGVDVEGRHCYAPPDPDLGIEHFSYDSIEHYLEKFNRYTSTEADQLHQQGGKLDWESPFREMVRDWHLYYELGQGERDGIHGWILAWLAGQYRWFSRAKLLDRSSPETLAGISPPPNLDAALAVMEEELARRRATRPEPPLGVVFHSPLWDPSGYAEDGRTLLRSLAAGERWVAARSIPWSQQPCPLPGGERSLYKALEIARRPKHAVAITNCIPTLVAPDPSAAFNILRTTCETDRIPASWLPRLESFDEIWVLSAHNARAFRRSGVAPEKLRILHPACDTEVFTPDGPMRPRYAPLANRFVFLSVLDWQLRKGWDALVKAYVEEFGLDAGVGLLLKVTRQHGHSIEEIQRQIDAVLHPHGSSLARRPDIVLLEECCEAKELAALYRSCDAFVLASRGEGWGRPYMEAMACGLPTIGTRGSGNADFMLDQNAFLVDVAEVEVSDEAAQEIPVFAGQRWNEPDLLSLRAQMRQIFGNRSRAAEVARRAVVEIREKFSLSALERRLADALTEIEQRLIPPPDELAESDAIAVELEGEFLAGHSFSNINEVLALAWNAQPDMAVTLTRRLLQPTQDRISPCAAKLKPLMGRSLGKEPDVVVRHAFPPNWTTPAGTHTKWIHIQPWEFGALPVDWIHPLTHQVDEIWAPSEYVRRVFLGSGIPAEKVFTIPWGIDEEVYNSAAPPLHLETDKGLKLLFVGGAIPRKGFDTLLEAYQQEFRRDEDICLVIKDLGVQSFYRYGHSRDALQAAMDDPHSPEILYIDANFTDGQRASLYTACQVLVAPYRGEGFGLPVLEAMACGLTPVIPQGGATDDFTRPEFAEYLEAKPTPTHHDWRLVGEATELEIEVKELRRVLRRLYDHRRQIADRGELAARFARDHYSWRRNVLPLMAERIRRLASDVSPPARSLPAPPLHGARAVVPHRLPITACLHACNAESQLGDTLARLAPFVEEIIVVDLGSADATVAIAQEYGARVYRQDGVDSYSTPLNGAFRHARQPWIWIAELGEYLADADWKKVAALLDDAPPTLLGIRFGGPDRGAWANTVLRLVRNDWRLVCQYRSLPSFEPSLAAIQGEVVDSGIPILNDPRWKPNAENQRRFEQFLQQDLSEHRGALEILLELGRRRFSSGDFFHAECYLNDALAVMPREDARFLLVGKMIVECHVAMGDLYRAEEMARRLSLGPAKAEQETVIV